MAAMATLLFASSSCTTSAFLLPATSPLSASSSSLPAARLRQRATTTMNSVITQPVEAIRGSDKEKLLDLSVLDRAMSGPPASLRVKDKNTEQLRVGIIGGGLGGLITAMDLAEAGHQVEIFEARRFAGGKVGSWVDNDGNHIEMGVLR